MDLTEKCMLTDGEIQGASYSGGKFHKFGHNYECTSYYRGVAKAAVLKAIPIVAAAEREKCIETLKKLGQSRAADDLFLFFSSPDMGKE